MLKTQLASAVGRLRADGHAGAAAHATPRPADARFAGAAAAPDSSATDHAGAWVSRSRSGSGSSLAVVAAAVYLALDSGAPGTDSKPRPQPPPTPRSRSSTPVSTPHAAHRLALHLARDRVHVVGIGNLGAAAPAALRGPVHTRRRDTGATAGRNPEGTAPARRADRPSRRASRRHRAETDRRDSVRVSDAPYEAGARAPLESGFGCALRRRRRIGPDDHGIGYGNDLGDGEIGP